MEMTKKLTKALIEMYWERKCLWQVRSDDYKKRDLKKEAYLDIVHFLRRNGMRDADVKMVRDKIQNLRRAMRKEKKKADESGGTYSPTLWYYDLLTFVNDQHDEPTRSFDVDVNEFEYDGESNAESLDKEHHIDSRPEPSTSNIVDMGTPHPSERLADKLDEYEAMGINVAAKVRRMETTQQVYAELLIQKVVAKGLLGQLSQSTEVVDLRHGHSSIE